MERFLVELSYCGFRYHGWAKQPQVKTIQGQVERTIQYIYPATKFKTLGCSRTDKMVSAEQFYFELFIEESLDLEHFKLSMLENLPQDISFKTIKKIDTDFNVIQDVVWKEYQYTFTDEDFHPFFSPFCYFSPIKLDVEIMKKAANLFLGLHGFSNFTHPLNENRESYKREILVSEIIENHESQLKVGSLELNRSFTFVVRSKGFLKSQVRMMVGAIIHAGQGKLTLKEIESALEKIESDQEKLLDNHAIISPASGLKLTIVHYENI